MRRVKHSLQLACVSIFCASLTIGCLAYRPTVAERPLQEDSRVILIGEGNAFFLRLVRLAAEPTPGGTLEARAQLLNDGPMHRQVDIRCDFRDRSGFAVDQTTWQPVLLRSNVAETFRCTSLSSTATDFRIYVRNSE